MTVALATLTLTGGRSTLCTIVERVTIDVAAALAGASISRAFGG
jgi:hypothetical protein